MIRSYGKIYNLGHAAVSELLNGVVTVEEKVDGSQFSFGWLDGKLHARSRGQQINLDAPDKMFAAGVETIKAVNENTPLTPGWTYRGEYLSGPKHNTLAYDRIPAQHVIIFDIDTGMESYLPPAAKRAEAARLGFEVVPVLLEGALTSYDAFAALMDTTSILGGPKVEGVVVKNYARFGLDGHALMGKYVSEAFKEIHTSDWKERNPAGKDIITRLIEMLCPERRWEKAVQHLREAGKLQDAPQDIGPLLKELTSDTFEEAEEIVKARLYAWAKKGIGRGLTRGFAEWYKQKLARQQFETVPPGNEIPASSVGGDAPAPSGAEVAA